MKCNRIVLNFEMYVHVDTCPKMMVETMMVEHFGVHHKGHKPSPTLDRQGNKYIVMLRMFATLTLGLCVGYGSSTHKILTHRIYAHT